MAVPSLDALVDGGHEVIGALTRPPAPAGRGRRLVDSPVAIRADALGIPVFTPTRPGEESFVELLRELAPEVCPVVAYGALLPTSVLEIPTHGWVNLHFSILPRWRGAAPVQRALIAGDPQVGMSTFQIVSKLDAGPVYATRVQPTDPQVSSGELLQEMSVTGAELLVETLELIEGGARPTPQVETGMTLAPKLTTEEARIDFRRDAPALHDHVRGYCPDPGAWTLRNGQRLKILRTRVADLAGLEPGELRVTRKQVWVGTGAGSLELIEVQPVGKRPMAGADWARGGITDGEKLG